jgi:hypothetical protein
MRESRPPHAPRPGSACGQAETSTAAGVILANASFRFRVNEWQALPLLFENKDVRLEIEIVSDRNRWSSTRSIIPDE